MKWWAIGACFLLSGVCSCTYKDPAETAAIQSHKQTKPIVAIAPVIDRSNSELPWSLSDEFTATLHHKFMQDDKLALVDHSQIRSIVRKLRKEHDPFTIQTSWIKERFTDAQFVVFLELIEHEEATTNTNAASPTQFNLALRTRVFDIRGHEPKIVLQELIRDTQYIPSQFSAANFDPIPWGSELFVISPLGMIHTQFSSKIARRIEEYILLSYQL